MKFIFTIAFLLCLEIASAQLPSDSLMTMITFENMKGYDKNYGKSADSPIGSGAFANMADRASLRLRMAKLESSYRWPNGAAIDFSNRGSMSGKMGIIDRYMLTNPETKETITLFVDPYHTDSAFYVPQGLILVTKEIYAKEIKIHLDNIDLVDLANDAFATENERMNNTMQYLALKVGIGNLLDRENVTKIITDTQANDNLKNYLINVYILHKFYALGKNLPNSRSYALKKMREVFGKFHQQHPEVNMGNIKINLN